MNYAVAVALGIPLVGFLLIFATCWYDWHFKGADKHFSEWAWPGYFHAVWISAVLSTLTLVVIALVLSAPHTAFGFVPGLVAP